jgi:hypothetical protein
VKQVFEAAAEPQAGEGGWTWQELLSSMDDAPVEDAQLADRLIGEIEGLGADIGALLPPARIVEIAAAIEAGEAPRVRALVRQLAPAAVRRLARLVMAERALRVHAERFLDRYAKSVQTTLQAKGETRTLADLLASDPGRAFLLFDAALGDVR